MNDISYFLLVLTSLMTKPSQELSSVILTLLSHQYEYKSPIGKGGYATVHLVRSLKYNQDFCVKLIPMCDISDSMTEIDTLMQLSSPLVIKMYEHFYDDDFFYIILEYCSGGSLLDYVREYGPLPKERLYQTCSALLLALQNCHDNKVAHRDIKPANVLIDSWGRPKLADFGLSKIYNDEALASNFAGSRPYMAPEILSRTAYNPFTADIWALGITFYYFAYGKLPWESNVFHEVELQIQMALVIQPIKTHYHTSFVNAIRMMCQLKPSQRPTIEWLLAQECFTNPNLNCRIRASHSSKDASIKLAHDKIDSNDLQYRKSVTVGSLKIFEPVDEKSKEKAVTLVTGRSIRPAQSGNLPVFTHRSNKIAIKCFSPQPKIISQEYKPSTLPSLPKL